MRLHVSARLMAVTVTIAIWIGGAWAAEEATTEIEWPTEDQIWRRSFVLSGDSYIAMSRMDPIVNLGKVSGHVHQIHGASNFRSVLNTPQEQQKAKCTSVKLSADKSNYWTPTVYWINKNNTYTPLPSGVRIYYEIAETHTRKTVPFPPGLRMISGKAIKRDPSAIEAQGLAHSIFRDHNAWPQFIPNGTVWNKKPILTGVNGKKIMFNIYFPSCGWKNQSLDSADHFEHMTWPIRKDGDEIKYDRRSPVCPDTHPIRYPTIFIETMFTPSEEMFDNWNEQGPNFIMSNGDTTGLTWHADFLNGWDFDVLNGFLEDKYNGHDNAGCNRTEQGGRGDRHAGTYDGRPKRPTDLQNVMDDAPDLKDCKAFTDHLNVTLFQECRLEGMIPNEEIGWLESLPQLPGCNPRWDWDGPETKPPCDNTGPADDPQWIAPQAQFSWADGGAIPVALPGREVSNLANLNPLSGYVFGKNELRPAFYPWASTNYGKKVIEGVTTGSKTGAIDVIEGQKDPQKWEATVPTSTIDIAATPQFNAAVSTHRTLDGYCNTHPGITMLLPCSPPTALPAADGSSQADPPADAQSKAARDLAHSPPVTTTYVHGRSTPNPTPHPVPSASPNKNPGHAAPIATANAGHLRRRSRTRNSVF